jgi:hypothetical protein
MGLKVIICGSRYYSDYNRIFNTICKMDISLVISGGCRGADTIAIIVARQCGFRYVEYRADWERYGNSAGPIRNQVMINCENPDIVLAFHNDFHNSKGTKDMVSRAMKHDIPFKIFSYLDLLILLY